MSRVAPAAPQIKSDRTADGMPPLAVYPPSDDEPAPSDPMRLGDGWYRMGFEFARALLSQVGGYEGVVIAAYLERGWAFPSLCDRPDELKHTIEPVRINLSELARRTGLDRTVLLRAEARLVEQGVLVDQADGQRSLSTEYRTWAWPRKSVTHDHEQLTRWRGDGRLQRGIAKRGGDDSLLLAPPRRPRIGATDGTAPVTKTSQGSVTQTSQGGVRKSSQGGVTSRSQSEPESVTKTSQLQGPSIEERASKEGGADNPRPPACARAHACEEPGQEPPPGESPATEPADVGAEVDGDTAQDDPDLEPFEGGAPKTAAPGLSRAEEAKRAYGCKAPGDIEPDWDILGEVIEYLDEYYKLMDDYRDGIRMAKCSFPSWWIQLVLRDLVKTGDHKGKGWKYVLSILNRWDGQGGPDAKVLKGHGLAVDQGKSAPKPAATPPSQQVLHVDQEHRPHLAANQAAVDEEFARRQAGSEARGTRILDQLQAHTARQANGESHAH